MAQGWKANSFLGMDGCDLLRVLHLEPPNFQKIKQMAQQRVVNGKLLHPAAQPGTVADAAGAQPRTIPFGAQAGAENGEQDALSGTHQNVGPGPRKVSFEA